MKISEGNYLLFSIPIITYKTDHYFVECRQMLTYGRRIPLLELDYRIEVMMMVG